jgi:hypothetical protein
MTIFLPRISPLDRSSSKIEELLITLTASFERFEARLSRIEEVLAIEIRERRKETKDIQRTLEKLKEKIELIPIIEIHERIFRVYRCITRLEERVREHQIQIAILQQKLKK